jgi:hypothetical protein
MDALVPLAELASKEPEIDCVRHGLIPGVARMEMIATVERRQKVRRIGRIAHSRVKIDHAVKFAAVADKGIGRFLRRLALFRTSLVAPGSAWGRPAQRMVAGARSRP